MKIVIDAGHGPQTPGKRSPDDSLREYHFNAPTARYVVEELGNYEGVEIMTTFEDDRDVPIDERVIRANSWAADVFVSIHANAGITGTWDDAGGIETLVDYRQPKAAVSLANDIQRKLIAATGLRDRGLKYRDDLGVLNRTKMTAVLVECGFMDNRFEVELLRSDEYRRRCARAIVSGLVYSYGLKRRSEENRVFTDVPVGHWCEADLALLKRAGIIEAFEDGTFRGDKVTTRYELAAALSQLLVHLNGGE